MKLQIAYKNRSLENLTIQLLFNVCLNVERIIMSGMTFWFHKVKLISLIVQRSKHLGIVVCVSSNVRVSVLHGHVWSFWLLQVLQSAMIKEKDERGHKPVLRAVFFGYIYTVHLCLHHLRHLITLSEQWIFLQVCIFQCHTFSHSLA